jgi:tripartite-type tricarboxylate transporter receptor subunit TctC
MKSAFRLSVALCFFLMLAAPKPAFPASDFPTKPINVVVPFAPGGSLDISTRPFCDIFSEKTGVPSVLLNKPGSGSLVGSEFVSKSKPDGHTILVFTLSLILRQIIDPKMEIDVFKDLEPVSRFFMQPLVVVAKGDSKLQTIDDLVDFARKNPGKLSMGSAGVGATSHFSGELIKKTAKIDFKHVPFGGDGPNITALMGGHIDFLVTSAPAVQGKVASGDLRLLATLSETRLPDYKEIPTMKEKGFTDAVMYSWFAFMAPPATPKEIVQKLDTYIKQTLKDDLIQRTFEKLGFQEAYLSSHELPGFMRSEYERFKQIAVSQGITIKD